MYIRTLHIQYSRILFLFVYILYNIYTAILRQSKDQFFKNKII